MNYHNQSDSDFYCTKCGFRGITLPRFGNHFRESGHLKIIYCLHCKQEWNHAEVSERGPYTYETFKIEFDNGNFDSLGNRIMPYNQFINSLRKKGIKQ